MLTEEARIFAARAHADQKYGELPYVDHLDAVVGVLARYGFSSPITIAAAYLHDIIEDTPMAPQALLRHFPMAVVATVLDVTNEPGKNRAERFAATYPKIAGNERALVVKLADRIANVEHSIESPGGHLAMYRKEYPGFRAALYSTNPKVAPMWRRLDELLGSA